MATKEIIIDGTIGAFAYSRQFVRNQLANNKNKEVTVKISSLGGDVDHAINIYDQFVEHGNITAELSAFVASSATIISLGARHVRMNENSFYLIHKVWQWVDEWGGMNEDDIEKLIKNLEHKKQQLAKVTLQLAKMYVKKTGKSLDEIIGLMKKETWLTAEEAKDWGFVDEVFAPEVPQNYLDDTKLVALVTSNDFPEPPRKHEIKKAENSTDSLLDEDSIIEKVWKKITNRSKEQDFIQTQNTKSMKQFTKLNDVLGVSALESSDDHVNLNETQLQILEDKFSEKDQAVANAESERDTAISEKKTAEQNFTDTISFIDEIDTAVADAKTPKEKADAIRNLLAAKAGANPEGIKEKNDPENSGEDFDGFTNEEKELTKNL